VRGRWKRRSTATRSQAESSVGFETGPKILFQKPSGNQHLKSPGQPMSFEAQRVPNALAYKFPEWLLALFTLSTAYLSAAGPAISV
jgi:hypothetical protein